MYSYCIDQAVFNSLSLSLSLSLRPPYTYRISYKVVDKMKIDNCPPTYWDNAQQIVDKHFIANNSEKKN